MNIKKDDEFLICGIRYKAIVVCEDRVVFSAFPNDFDKPVTIERCNDKKHKTK